MMKAQTKNIVIEYGLPQNESTNEHHAAHHAVGAQAPQLRASMSIIFTPKPRPTTLWGLRTRKVLERGLPPRPHRLHSRHLGGPAHCGRSAALAASLAPCWRRGFEGPAISGEAILPFRKDLRGCAARQGNYIVTILVVHPSACDPPAHRQGCLFRRFPRSPQVQHTTCWIVLPQSHPATVKNIRRAIPRGMEVLCGQACQLGQPAPNIGPSRILRLRLHGRDQEVPLVDAAAARILPHHGVDG
mmetsp:Transcript_91836/g.196807  ORF Transcript_91836/g.196807 Transcript_91836/m.196807 type:complete len:244 (-) Transcript_91836:1261-1992(-)